MTDKIIENNQVSIMGKIISGFVFSHEVFGEGFYMVDVSGAATERIYGYHSGNDFGAAD